MPKRRVRLNPTSNGGAAAAKRQKLVDAPPQPAAPLQDLSDPGLYINRELSLLAFQRRVLEEAEDERNPLLERVKFLSIVGSNLDEFFMVRVAGLVAQMDAGILDAGPDGMPPRAQLIAIRREVKKLLAEGHKCLTTELYPVLAEAGIQILEYQNLTGTQQKIAAKYFSETVFPVLTPLAFDPPALSAHLQPESESGRSDPRPPGSRAFRAREGSRFITATHRSESRGKDQGEKETAGASAWNWSGSSRSSRRICRRCFRG